MYRVLSYLFRVINRAIIWHRLPLVMSVINLLVLRYDLRQKNLFDTSRNLIKAPELGDFDIRGFRTADGSNNDLADPAMGMRYMRFGRNVPLKYTYGEKDEDLFTPNPREISNKLLARKEFIPVPHLNVHAASWLQFMTHDWFSHGNNDPDRLINIPLPEGDSWDEEGHVPGHISVRATLADDVRGETDEGMPAAYRNRETHWWDGSQIYGSTPERMWQVRSGPDGNLVSGGRLYVDEEGLLGIDPENNVELAGVNGNWWLGLSLMTTLFVHEHNSIAARLQVDYPYQTDEWIFQKARLINAALITKIHTVEWTPALLNNPTMRYAMRGNWWGVLGEQYERAYGRDAGSEVLGGIPGSKAEHYVAPYSITEEFVAVYRMHPLLPDEFKLCLLRDNREIETLPLQQVAGELTRQVYEKVEFADAWYSLGIAHPGLLRLHNFPNALRRLKKQGKSGHVVDLASIDILRDRERGVPRYCEFRRLLRMGAPASFEELTEGDKETAEELAAVYDHIEDVDLLIGCLAEPLPAGFGFSETAFRIFILMASRRIKSDRFYTDDFDEKTYTPVGMRWIVENGMASVIVRHMPDLANKVNRVKNVFFPWPLD